jgi:hypothetical protein
MVFRFRLSLRLLVGAPDHPSAQPGIRAAESWRGLRFTEFELRRLDAGEKTCTPNEDGEVIIQITGIGPSGKTFISQQSK